MRLRVEEEKAERYRYSEKMKKRGAGVTVQVVIIIFFLAELILFSDKFGPFSKKRGSFFHFSGEKKRRSRRKRYIWAHFFDLVQ